MSESTIDDLEQIAYFGFVTGCVPPLLAPDHLFHTAVIATWIEPDTVLQWMDDVEDQAAGLLAAWGVERGTSLRAAA